MAGNENEIICAQSKCSVNNVSQGNTYANHGYVIAAREKLNFCARTKLAKLTYIQQ